MSPTTSPYTTSRSMSWGEWFRGSCSYAVAYARSQLDGLLYSGLPVFFWVKPTWSASQMKNLTGKVVIVTGGNSGIGYAICKAMYEHGATVYMACRSEKRAREAIDAIHAGAESFIDDYRYPSGHKGFAKPERLDAGRIEFLELDLADLNSVDRFVTDFATRETHLDLVFANAGIMATPGRQYTKQGISLQFGTNCVGHQRLLELLLPLLLKTAEESPKEPPRVIVSSSAGHLMAPTGGIDYLSMMRPAPGSPESPRRRGLSPWTEYGQSKWGCIALARWLHWHHGPQQAATTGTPEILSVSYHPGMVSSNLASHLPFTPFVLRHAPWLISFVTRTPAVGAVNPLWIATCPVAEARVASGGYLIPYERLGQAHPSLDDKKRVDEMWEWCSVQSSRHS